jgi:hypothetical protein
MWDWGQEICWCNPPYTRYVIDRWVQKAYEASKAGATVVCLLPVSTTSHWWTRYVDPYAEITYLRKRLGSMPLPSVDLGVSRLPHAWHNSCYYVP